MNLKPKLKRDHYIIILSITTTYLQIKVKLKDNYHLNIFFGFCRTFKKITKHLGVHSTFKLADLQGIIYITLGDNVKVNFDKSFFYIPIFIPNAQIQLLFDDCFKSSFTLSFDSWSTDGKTVHTQLDYQVNIGSAQKINSPKCLIVAHQTAVRIGTPSEANIVLALDNLNVRNYHVDCDSVRYPRDDVSIDYNSNDYVDQYRDLKLFYKEYAGEELTYPYKVLLI